jgi:DNA repair exonuclease SbcCD ATPase subunit
MRIHGVRIHNALSYGEHHNVLEFDKGATRFLQSRAALSKLERESMYADAQKYLAEWNKDETSKIVSIIGKTDSNRRESNGSGKSTGFEAIAYALYEKLLRESVDKDEDRNKGRATSSIIREISPGVLCSEAFVELLFSVNDNLWLLRRGRKLQGDKSSAILRLDCLTSPDFAQQGSRSGHRLADTGSTLKSLIKWDFETFCNSIMFGQFDSGQFLIGTDKVRKNIIINILNLGVVTDYLAECRVRKIATQHTIDSLQAQLNVLSDKPIDPVPIRANIATIQGQIDLLKRMQGEGEIEISKLRRSEDMSKYQTAVTEANLKLELLNQKRHEEDGKVRLVQVQLDQANAAWKTGDANLKSYISQKESARSGLELMQNQYASFDATAIEEQLKFVQAAKEAKPNRKEQESQALAQMSVYQFDIGKLQNHEESIREQLQNRKQLGQINEPVQCPTCGSLVTPEHLAGETERFKKDLDDTVAQRAEKDRQALENVRILEEARAKIKLIDEYLAKEAVWSQQLENHKRLGENIATASLTLKSFDEIISSAQTIAEEARAACEKFTNQIIVLNQQSTEQLRPYQEQYDVAKAIADGLSSGVIGIQQAIAKLVEQQAGFQMDMSNKLLEVGRLETQAVNAESNGAKVLQIQGDLGTHQKQLNRLKILEQMYGVDGVQTAIVDKYLPLLNSYLHEYIDIVGGGKIHVAIVTDGKKDGKVDLVITGQSASRSVMLSGGEKIKVRLAISLALGLLAFARSHEVPEFICLDEVIAPVDELTKEHIFSMLKQLQEHFRTIMVISHDKTLQENIPHEIVVNKIRGISRIEKQFWEQEKEMNHE